MTLSVSLVIISALGLLALMSLAGRRRRHLKIDVNQPNSLRPVDIEAFRNLTDPEEDAFLREYLPPRDFRQIRRQRLIAALEYVRWSLQNAQILLRIGEAASHNTDPAIATAGQRLMNDAVRLRMLASLAAMRLCIGIALPGTDISAARLVDQYQQLNGMARQLAVMQRPAPANLAIR